MRRLFEPIYYLAIATGAFSGHQFVLGLANGAVITSTAPESLAVDKSGKYFRLLGTVEGCAAQVGLTLG